MQATGQTILIVEDERDIASQIQLELEDEGYRVSTAANGIEALESLERQPLPDLILLDLLLPKMDGWQFLRNWRELEGTAQVPVIALSAVSYRGAPGATAVLPKPINFDVLMTLITQVRHGRPAR